MQARQLIGAAEASFGMDFDGSVFNSVTVELDGNRFTNCQFNDCTLVYRGGPPASFEGCTFFRSPFQWAGAALRTLEFLTQLNRTGFEETVEATLRIIRDPQAGFDRGAGLR